MNTTTRPSAEELLERLEHGRTRRHSLQAIVSGTFMTAIVVLVGLLSLFNIYALERVQRQQAELQADVRVTQRVAVNSGNNTVARAVKDVFDDMRDLQRAEKDQIAHGGLSAALARSSVDEARRYLLGAVPRVSAQARLVAEVADEGRRLPRLNARDLATLRAFNALRTFDARSGELIDPGKDKSLATASYQTVEREVPALAAAAAKMRTLARLSRADLAAQAGIAQLHFIVAQRLNYPAALCAESGALAAAVRNAKPFPLKVVINNADCLRKTGNVGEANQEFASAVAQYNAQKGEKSPELGYRALRGRATTAIALPDLADKKANDERLAQAIADLRQAGGLSKANGDTLAQQQGVLENIGFALLRQGKLKETLEHTQKVDEINPLAWNLTVQAIAAAELGNNALAEEARAKLRAFRRPQFNECEVRLLLGSYASRLDPLLRQVKDADIKPAACSGA